MRSIVPVFPHRARALHTNHSPLKFALGFLLSAVLACLLFPTAQAKAQASYPSKPIQITGGFAGLPDTIARLVATAIETTAKQKVIVEVKGGAGGLLAARFVSQQAPDGYSLLLGTDSLTLLAELSSDPSVKEQTDLEPISQVASFPLVFITSTKKPYQNFRELLDAARSSPGKLNYASSGASTYSFIIGEALKKEAGVDIAHVPYKGGAEMAVALLGGQVDFAHLSTGFVLPYIRDGAWRPLAIASPGRSSLFPDVPSVHELGYKSLGSGATTFSIFAPRGMKPEVKADVERIVTTALADPAFQKKIAELGGEMPKPGSAELGKFTSDLRVYFKKTIAEFGVKAE